MLTAIIFLFIVEYSFISSLNEWGLFHWSRTVPLCLILTIILLSVIIYKRVLYMFEPRLMALKRVYIQLHID